GVGEFAEVHEKSKGHLLFEQGPDHRLAHDRPRSECLHLPGTWRCAADFRRSASTGVADEPVSKTRPVGSWGGGISGADLDAGQFRRGGPVLPVPQLSSRMRGTLQLGGTLSG